MFRIVFASIFVSANMFSFSSIVVAQDPPVAYSFIFPSGDSESWLPNCNDFRGICNLPDRWHTGEDVPAPAGTPVYAPTHGIVKHASARSGYGYVVIVEHNFNNQEYVCSVNGHMRGYDLRVSVGQVVSKGNLLGFLGTQQENGGWIPHFHLGMSKGRYKGDFEPGCPSNPGEWWYSGYTKCESYLDNWYDPSDFINRHIVLTGYFPDGWHTDGVSQAFLETYNSFQESDGHNKLGQPHPSLPYVYQWGETQSFVQVFDQPDASRPRFQDGFAWMMYNPDHRRCYVITLTFYFEYAGVPGDIVYGLPLNNEHTDASIGNLIGRLGEIFIRQDFSLNKTMLWGGNPAIVSVIDTPPGTVKIAGGATPLTLSGQAITKTQVFLTWNGGMELESNDVYVLRQNGSEVVTTTLREAMLTNLTPGLTYIFSVALVNAVYGILERSQDITITLPQDNRFELLPEVRDSNYVYLTIINERFPDAYALAIYRDNTEIGRTQNSATTQFSDSALLYNTSYIYKVGAVTASSLILGWTPEVIVTTQSPPVSAPPPSPPPTPLFSLSGMAGFP